MNSWSAKRKFFYGSVFVLVLLALAGGVSYKVFYRTPTCSDGVQNGNETGVDCGGSCQLLCTSDALTPVVFWSKIFPVSGDLYTAVAYIQNPNINSSNASAQYEFKIYDADNKLIFTKNGTTNIPKNKKFAVFEVGLVLPNVKPASADFAFTSFSDWKKDTTAAPNVTIVNSTLLASSTSPRITGTITNNSLTASVKTLELDAFVLDNNQNVLGASRTFVDNLAANSSQDFVFTWPQSFVGNPSVVTVIYR